jgi:hypothetical protein
MVSMTLQWYQPGAPDRPLRNRHSPRAQKTDYCIKITAFAPGPCGTRIPARIPADPSPRLSRAPDR